MVIAEVGSRKDLDSHTNELNKMNKRYRKHYDISDRQVFLITACFFCRKYLGQPRSKCCAKHYYVSLK